MPSSLSFVLYFASFLVTLQQYQPHLLLAVAQSTSLATGSSLVPPNYITSRSGDFAFGFRVLDSDPTQFILAVWFNFKPSDPALQNVVWFATDASSGSAVIATKQSVLSITGGLLSLADNAVPRWTNPNPNQRPVSVVVLRDDGNLQLLVDANHGGLVWESFDLPTDTLLPGQTMGSGTRLLSKNTDTDFSVGRFGLSVQGDGNIVLYMMDLQSRAATEAIPYWATGTNKEGPTLYFDDPGNLYYSLRTENDTVQHNLTTRLHNSTTKYYQYARLDPDGTVRVYIRPKTTMDGGKAGTSWDVAGQFPSDGCGRTTGLQGMCGPNSYCTVRSKAQYIDCECPTGYVFVDARYNYQGCRADFVPHSCDGKNHSADFNLVELPNTTKWRTDLAYYKKHPSTMEELCREICLNDCFCTAALLSGSYCIEMGLLIGDREVNDTTVRKAWIKVRTTDPSRMISKLRYIIIAMCLLAFATVTMGLLVFCHFRKKKANESLFIARVFTYRDLHQATNGFKEVLGRGGFGVVYKGVLKSTAVAVKKLSYLPDYTEKEFTKEVQSIGRIHHRNLIRMIGYCKEGRHRILVFEFMSGGSLGDYMKRQERPPWSWLAETVLGIARGLEYLHYGCTYPIIHCDIKPDNILLDHNCAPRITDFGISKLLSDQQVQTNITNFMGTRGYLAPEWLDDGNNVDSKVDVYSFGIVLLQMICWKITFDERSPDDKDASTLAGLKEWALNLIRNGRTELLVQGESEVSADMESVKLARVAIWCIEKDPLVRPTMRKVVLMLEGTVVVDPLPDPPRPPESSDCSTILSAGNGTDHSEGTVNTLQIE